MPPKRSSLVTEDLEEIKKSLDMLTEEVTAISLQQKKILKLADDVKDSRF